MGPAILVAVAFAAALAMMAELFRDRTPLLAPASFETARKTWMAAGIADYDLALEVTLESAAPSIYRLKVRGGKPASFTIDGREQEPGRGAPYSITGLFDIIEQEMEIAAGKAPAQPGAPVKATLRAEFDGRRGFPKAFKRLAGKGQSCFIAVREFQPAGGKEPQ